MRVGTVPRSVWAIVAVFCALAPALAQTLGQATDDGISTWRVVLALLVCLGLAAMIPYVLKARAGGFLSPLLGLRRGRRLQVIESVRLSHQAELCLVKLDGGEFVVSVSAKGVEILRPLEPAANNPEASG